MHIEMNEDGSKSIYTDNKIETFIWDHLAAPAVIGLAVLAARFTSHVRVEEITDDETNKTMLRQLISKWAPMSVDMQKGIEKDVAGSEVVEADYTEIIDFNQAQPEPEPAQIEHDEVGNFDTQQILNAEGKAKEPEPLKVNADGEVL